MAGMQDASLATAVKVHDLAITGPQTVDNGQTFVATLAQTQCDLVLAVGDTSVASVNTVAANYPKTTFVTIGGNTTRPNVSTVAGSGGTLRSACRQFSSRRPRKVRDRLKPLTAGLIWTGRSAD
jgi:basic membrane lipoprotein Med (substrate-binding protein (PBP1-ABC) superfamily)